MFTLVDLMPDCDPIELGSYHSFEHARADLVEWVVNCGLYDQPQWVSDSEVIYIGGVLRID